MPGDDVNLPFGAAVVGFQDAIAVLFQKVPGQFFTQDTGISAFQFGIMSLTGLKEWR